jgi:hypothetical protein
MELAWKYEEGMLIEIHIKGKNYFAQKKREARITTQFS